MITKEIHSFWAYIALGLLIFTVVVSLLKRKNGTFTKSDKTLLIATLSAIHMQFIFGVVHYFISGRHHINGEIMKDGLARFYAMEHPMLMVVAVVLVTIGHSKAKKQATDTLKFKKISIFHGIALLLVLTVGIKYAAWWGA